MGTIVVEIPSRTEHEGYEGYLIKVQIPDTCPKCGAKRAVSSWRGLSYDGSRRLNVDCWKNECGHIDKYSDVRNEGTRVAYDSPTITGH